MDNIKKIAITRALALLNAAGAKYAIIDEDGTHYGELTVEKPKTGKKQNRTGYSYLHLYKAAYETLQPGQSVKITVPNPLPNGITYNHIVSALSGAAISRWGKGSTIVALSSDRKVVEVLRVS